ncbi:MAG: prepilin-type N-terminal cleavage/methylation domain-containing protein [Calditerrivibrio sp.]|nr:prepilin-type N-terminal cleavage/methylation domain-containing protein [Calditerrivibrio sp.]
MRYKAYSLIELLVTISIMLIVLSAVYLTYISMLKGYKRESAIGGKIIEEQIGIEILRKDITLAGLGLSDNTIPISISGSGDNITLTLYSTQSPSSDKTQGYIMLRFDNATNSWNNISDQRVDKTNNNLIVLDGYRKKWTKGTLSSGNISQTSPYPNNNHIAFGYPLINLTNDYETIEYKIGGTPPARCNPSTKNLIRGTIPILNCVKGFKVYLGADTNNDGSADSYYDNMSVAAFDNVTKIYNNLQTISIFILTHDGGKDNSFNFGGNSITFADSEIGENIVFSLNGVTDYQNYRWKVLKVSGRAVNIRGVNFSE